MPLLLAEPDVQRVLPMADLILAMESALVRFSLDQVTQPLRNVLEVGSGKSFFGVMPAYIPGSSALGVKVVGVFDGNAKRGLESHLSTIALFDTDTGALIALMDGRYITEARTAAVSAVATRHLAHASDVTKVCVIGSGVQARSHLLALNCIRQFVEVRVWSPDRVHREHFAKEESKRFGLSVLAAENAEEAAQVADLIVLATSASEPVLMSQWVSDGAHVISVGACRPHQREMDPSLVARARLFVDSRESALTESGDIVLSIAEGHFGAEHIVAEIGEIINGRVQGRTSLSEVTIFKSLGMAVEDITAAAMVYERARAEGLGTDVSI